MATLTKLFYPENTSEDELLIAQKAVRETEHQARMITKASCNLEAFLKLSKFAYPGLSEFEQEQAKQKIHEVVTSVELFVAKARFMDKKIKEIQTSSVEESYMCRARELYLEAQSAENYGLTIISLRLQRVAIDLQKRKFPASVCG